MKFEIDPNDPFHDQIEQLWDKLSINGLMTELIGKAENAIPPEKRLLTPEVLFGAMKSWLRELNENSETIEAYSASEAATLIEGRMGKIAFAVQLKAQRGQSPDESGGWHRK